MVLIKGGRPAAAPVSPARDRLQGLQGMSDTQLDLAWKLLLVLFFLGGFLPLVGMLLLRVLSL